jgi:BatD DUF11 like domain
MQSWLGIWLILFAQTDDGTRLAVSVQVRPGPVFVGEAVELSVDVAAQRERPEIEAPNLNGADLTLIKAELRPISTSGIGGEVFVKNLFRFRYRLIPRKPGALAIPAFHAKLDGRSGASEPTRLTIKPLPNLGRTADFLGGVGAFALSARAEPDSVRLGQTFAYRITIEGPAAWNVDAPPSLARLQRADKGFTIERQNDIATAEPPEHTFIFRLRPMRGGDLTIPPISIAAFDPKSERYVTRATPSVLVRVADVPAFDPSQMIYKDPSRRTSHLGLWPLVTGMLVLAIATLGGWMRWWHARRETAPSRALKALRAALRRAHSAEEVALATTEGLTRWLALATGRAEGALTPDEAETGVTSWTGDPGLAHAARVVVERCDGVLYGRSPAEADDLRNQAASFAARLSERPS